MTLRPGRWTERMTRLARRSDDPTSAGRQDLPYTRTNGFSRHVLKNDRLRRIQAAKCAQVSQSSSYVLSRSEFANARLRLGQTFRETIETNIVPRLRQTLR